jgi:TnpA family transposase
LATRPPWISPALELRIYILRYLNDPELRHRVQLQLNRGESRHDLAARCLFFANRGEFRTGDVDEIMNKASCLSLLSNAVLVWGFGEQRNRKGT